MSNNHGATGMTTIVERACQVSAGSVTMERDDQAPISQVFGRLVECSKHSGLEGTAKEELLGKLDHLAQSMFLDLDEEADGPADAGIAFFGQFIDHDLTLDATTQLREAAQKVETIRNFRTPRLDLDCVYGNGPEVSPHLYNKGALVVGQKAIPEGHDELNAVDFERTSAGRALIGDPRNDENLFVSQVHVQQFVYLHNNRVADLLRTDPELEPNRAFEEAREYVVAKYHDRILTEFLPQVVSEDVLNPLLDQYEKGALKDSGKIVWENAPDMPVEFSAAAYRFGHSMIRQRYDLNDEFPDVPIFAEDDTPAVARLGGFRPVKKEHTLNLAKFFNEGGQKSRAIDTVLPNALSKLPDDVADNPRDKNLALRNLERGTLTFGLPSGERMAEVMDKPMIDTTHSSYQKAVAAGLEGDTPLWFYCLAEAEQNGGKLGAVGGTLVAGVLLNLLIRQSRAEGRSAEERFEQLIVSKGR